MSQLEEGCPRPPSRAVQAPPGWGGRPAPQPCRGKCRGGGSERERLLPGGCFSQGAGRVLAGARGKGAQLQGVCAGHHGTSGSPGATPTRRSPAQSGCGVCRCGEPGGRCPVLSEGPLMSQTHGHLRSVCSFLAAPPAPVALIPRQTPSAPPSVGQFPDQPPLCAQGRLRGGHGRDRVGPLCAPRLTAQSWPRDYCVHRMLTAPGCWHVHHRLGAVPSASWTPPPGNPCSPRSPPAALFLR